MKQKEKHYENAIKALLKEEIPRSLHESGHFQSSRSNQVPVSAGQRFSCNTREGEVPVSVCKERAAPALVPALASLVTIAVESELILCLSHYYCIYSSHIITPLINSSLYSCVTYRQVKEMVALNLFIESPLQVHCIKYQRKAHPYSSLVHS